MAKAKIDYAGLTPLQAKCVAIINSIHGPESANELADKYRSDNAARTLEHGEGELMPTPPHNAAMPLNVAYIKRRRDELKLSQQQCADLAGMSNRQKWCDVETGDADNPKLKTLEAIAKALKCRVADLIK
jgi:DNA-binding XRE family transcriptional regulator